MWTEPGATSLLRETLLITSHHHEHHPLRHFLHTQNTHTIQERDTPMHIRHFRGAPTLNTESTSLIHSIVFDWCSLLLYPHNLRHTHTHSPCYGILLIPPTAPASLTDITATSSSSCPGLHKIRPHLRKRALTIAPPS